MQLRRRPTAAGLSIAVGLTLALLSACRGGGAPRAATEVRDSLGLRITDTDARLVERGGILASVTDTLARVGSPDDRPGSEALFQVSAARFLEEGRFVVLQGGSELRFYDRQGRRTGAAGRRGDGPGEYARATALRATRDGDLAVWDAEAGRVSIVSARGDFIGSRNVDLDAVARDLPSILQIRPESRWDLLDEDRLLVFDYSFADMPAEGPARPRVRYVVWRVDGAGADTLGEYGGIEQTSVPRSRVVVPTLDPEDSYFAADERTGDVWVGDGGTSHVDRYDREGALVLRVELEGVDRTPDPRHLERARAELLEQLGRRGLGSMEGPVDEMAAREDAPVFRGLATDDSDRLWIRWGRQSDPSRVVYAVFGRDGIFQGRVALPPHERILAIASDRLLLLHRSPEGIETLGVYGIGR